MRYTVDELRTMCRIARSNTKEFKLFEYNAWHPSHVEKQPEPSFPIYVQHEIDDRAIIATAYFRDSSLIMLIDDVFELRFSVDPYNCGHVLGHIVFYNISKITILEMRYLLKVAVILMSRSCITVSGVSLADSPSFEYHKIVNGVSFVSELEHSV